MNPSFTLRASYQREDDIGVAYLVARGEEVPDWISWKTRLGIEHEQLGPSAAAGGADFLLDNMMNPLEPGEADRLEVQYGVENGRWYFVTYIAYPISGGRLLFIADMRPVDEDEPKEARERR